MLDLPDLFRTHALAAHGVVHVGAHEGQELPVYRGMGFPWILLVEAHPAIFARLRATCLRPPTSSSPAARCATGRGRSRCA